MDKQAHIPFSSADSPTTSMANIADSKNVGLADCCTGCYDALLQSHLADKAAEHKDKLPHDKLAIMLDMFSSLRHPVPQPLIEQAKRVIESAASSSQICSSICRILSALSMLQASAT